MPSISDFLSWNALLPAVLALLAAIMSWRGLHLSGDAKRAPLWGGLSVATFLVALFVGALANHDANEAILKAQKDANDSNTKLSAIQDGIADLKKVVAPDGKSTTEVVSLAVDRLQAQQQELQSLREKLQDLKRAGRLDNHFYQDGKDSAAVTFVQGNYDASTGILKLEALTSQQPFDFDKEIEFQKARVHCDSKQPTASAVMGANMNLTYYGVTCHVLGPIQQ